MDGLRSNLQPLLHLRRGFSLISRRSLCRRHSRHRVIRTPVQLSSGKVLPHTAPLLEEERNARLPALFSHRLDPLLLHRPRLRSRLSADNHPVDPVERDVLQRSDKRFAREEPYLPLTLSRFRTLTRFIVAWFSTGGGSAYGGQVISVHSMWERLGIYRYLLRQGGRIDQTLAIN